MSKLDKKLDIVTVMLYSFVGICLIFPALMGVLPFLFDNTTCHVIQRFYMPKFIMANPTVELVYMVCFYVSHVFLGMVTVLTAIICVLMLFFKAGKSLKPSIPQNGESVSWEKFFLITRNFLWAVRVYRRSYLIWESSMQFGFVLFPSLILAGYLINVVTTFSCIRLYDQLPVSMFLMLFFMDIGILVITVVFHAYSLVICKDFKKFYLFWKVELKGKRSYMILRSCNRPKVKLGSFCELKSSTILSTIMQIVDMTVTLLLV